MVRYKYTLVLKATLKKKLRFLHSTVQYIDKDNVITHSKDRR